MNDFVREKLEKFFDQEMYSFHLFLNILPPSRTGQLYVNGDAESFTTESNYSDDWGMNFLQVIIAGDGSSAWVFLEKFSVGRKFISLFYMILALVSV